MVQAIGAQMDKGSGLSHGQHDWVGEFAVVCASTAAAA